MDLLVNLNFCISITNSCPGEQAAGTNGTNVNSILNDVEAVLVPLSSTLTPFSNLTSGTPYVHLGFQSSYERSIATILNQTSLALEKYNATTTVIVTGHSLGSPIAVLTALALRLHFGEKKTVKSITYAQPRMGNAAFADIVDAVVSPPLPSRYCEKLHPTNHLPSPLQIYQFPGAIMTIFRDDPCVPFYSLLTLPFAYPSAPPSRNSIPHLLFPRSLGYTHSSGEHWIANVTTGMNNTITGDYTLVCPGRENKLCSNSVVATSYNLDDHLG